MHHGNFTVGLIAAVALSLTAAAGAGATPVSAGPQATSAATSIPGVTCRDVIFVGVRGSGEGGHDALGNTLWYMAQRFKSKLGKDGMSMDYIGVRYLAAGVETLIPDRSLLGVARWKSDNYDPYIASIEDGITKAKTMIKKLSKKCEDSDLVLAGYSQGAMAIHLAENELSDEGQQDALDAIAGTLLLGDGDRVHDSSAHLVGSSPSDKEGVRSYFHTIEQRDVYDPELTAEICDANDIVCDFDPSRIRHAPTFVKVHTGYLERKTRLNQAVDWLYDEALAP